MSYHDVHLSKQSVPRTFFFACGEGTSIRCVAIITPIDGLQNNCLVDILHTNIFDHRYAFGHLFICTPINVDIAGRQIADA